MSAIIVRLSPVRTRVFIPGAETQHEADAFSPIAVREAVGRTIRLRDTDEELDAAEVQARASGPRRYPHSPAPCPLSSAQRRATWNSDEEDERIFAQIGKIGGAS